MDKLGMYFSDQKIDEHNRKNVPFAAYTEGLQKVINITDKTTKSCQNNHEIDKDVDYYSQLVSDCVIRSLEKINGFESI